MDYWSTSVFRYGRGIAELKVPRLNIARSGNQKFLGNLGNNAVLVTSRLGLALHTRSGEAEKERFWKQEIYEL